MSTKTNTPKAPRIAPPAKPSNNHQAPSLRERFQAGRDALKLSLVERDSEVDLALTALVAQEHVLLVGEPGTAKSMVVEGIRRWISGARSLTIHCCKDTTRNVAFGPLKLSALKDDKTDRALEGGAAAVEVLVLEEVFKSGPAVLDMFLMLMNERVYREGLVAAKAPLKLLLGVSNEWAPEGCEAGLEAFFDRFLFRKKVRPVSKQAGRRALLKRAVARDLATPSFPDPLSVADIDLAHAQSLGIPLSDQCRKDMWRLLEELEAAGISPGDRRLVKAVGAVRAAAWLDGANEVSTEHLEILAHVLWDDPTEQPEKCAKIVGKIANPTSFRINELLMQAEDVCSKATGRKEATEAVPKLQEIGSMLEALGTADPRVAKASTHVRGLIKSAYQKVIGGKEEEE